MKVATLVLDSPRPNSDPQRSSVSGLPLLPRPVSCATSLRRVAVQGDRWAIVSLVAQRQGLALRHISQASLQAGLA